jgi:LPXTG-site transpeptidase (sortase) family protein
MVLLLALVLMLALAVTGGLFYRSRSDDNSAGAPVLIGEAEGPDAAPGESAVVVDDPPMLGEEWLRAVQAAVFLQELEEKAAKDRAAYAAARAEGEAIASDAVRRWGAGHLLLALPSIGVTASVAAMGYERDGRTPATPNSPWGVAWYSFSDYPGTAGNAVFSGHVDWYTGAPAVFGRLRSVGVGDPIYVVLADGTPVAYRVAESYYVSPYTANVAEIFGVTASEAITFITCGGAWDAVAKDYSHRLIVRAYRVW